MSDWYVSSEESLSDHIYICFNTESQDFETVICKKSRRLIGLHLDKTFQLSLGEFQRTYVRGWTWSWPLMQCSITFSCPTITTAGLGLLIHQGKFLGGP